MVQNDEADALSRGSRFHKVMIVAVPALVVVGVIVFGVLKSAPDNAAPGKALPDFSLPLVNAEGELTSDDLEGHPVVINFWASWCAPCREEAPLFESAWKQYRDQGLQVIGINVQDSEIGAKEFVNEFGLTYPVAIDLHEDLAKQLDIFGLPQTYFVDSEGKFFATKAGPELGKRGSTVKLGAISEEELKSTIEDLLDH